MIHDCYWIPNGCASSNLVVCVFFFVCWCCCFVIALFRVVVEFCVARIYSQWYSVGKKIIIFRIKTSSLFISLSLFLSPTTTTSERERERERRKREGRERFSSIFVLWWWIKIKGRWSPRTTTKKQRRLHPHHRMLFIITIMVSNNNKTIILRRCDRKPWRYSSPLFCARFPCSYPPTTPPL